jgi:isoleucyl-tRNA synthetase
MTDNKSEIAKKEEKILEFWKENKIFEKTLEKEAPEGDFVFYEGPPTANAKPALHHLEARVFKDIIPRYRTMKGYRVRRKGGWDTHGLPVELQIEKKLGLKSKKEIEQYGVEKFNKECKDSVFEYISDWETFTDRIAYWVDKENAYYTFNTDYIESVWNIIKTVNDRGLLYKDYKVLPWCPRCGTALSSHELAQGYQDDKDLSVTAKFKITNPEKIGLKDDVYILAWTTTPWTLPGNVALAVGENIIYVGVQMTGEKGTYIVAKDLAEKLLPGGRIDFTDWKGKELVGLKYEPLYHFLANKFDKKDPIAFEKSYQVYSADFVNTEDGTGIVHTAVMYGQDDFVLGTEIGLPKHHLVKDDGHFADEMDFLSNRFVKDEEVAVDIIKDLAHRGFLFKKEKYEHSYPHCWRCKTPLIYYARDSWYIAMSKLRDELVKENEGINWEPAHIKEGRFGEWLREIKDWALSRERYWGTPLPVWSDEEGNIKVIGSVEELKKYTKKSGNKYFVMRHGETEGNLKGVWNVDSTIPHALTEKGIKQVEESAEHLKGKEIDHIFVSPFSRTHQTAEIIVKKLGLSKDVIVEDKRLGEWNVGVEFDGKSVEDFFSVRNKSKDKYEYKTEDGESYADVVKRAGEFLYEIENNYQDKNILVVSHGSPSRALALVSEGVSYRKSDGTKAGKNFDNAELRELEFVPLPHNSEYETDLHKPFIDNVNLTNENGKSLKRAKEVIDVWFDSGAMPFAQDHYPFEKGMQYPADFISEAIDQTRGWFYTLHAIGVLMDKGKAFKNVICLGHILDKEGKKMSKSIGNIVDPWEMINKYGVDALRLWMYGVNQPGDSKNFDEKTVDEIVKKVFNPLENIFALYDLYKDNSIKAENKSENVLDKWILSRFFELVSLGGGKLEEYKVFEGSRALRDFASDFSTWYIRRSRERFKGDNMKDKNDALSTTKYILLNLSKYMAPFTPFFAESLYQKLREVNDPQSVHLERWPEVKKVDKKLLQEMQEVRELVSYFLDLRQKAGLKVRQPLSSITLPEGMSSELANIVREEVNVKSINYVMKMDTLKYSLNTELTPELLEEGKIRDAIRAIQDWRKENNLIPGQIVKYKVPDADKNFFEMHAEEIKKATGVEF